MSTISLFEHHNGIEGYFTDVDSAEPQWSPIEFKNTGNFCVNVCDENNGRRLTTSYYVGCDWLHTKVKPVYVAPKLDKNGPPTNYLQMLLDALQTPEGIEYADKLFELKIDASPICISKEDDLITPLLVIHFIQLVKHIARKGLKKGYYRVHRNLSARVKGKILVGTTIKKNHIRGKQLYTTCQFNEFGVNCFENRFLKKVIRFCTRYISSFETLRSNAVLRNDIGYVLGAFDLVDEEIDVRSIKEMRINSFYKDYSKAIALGELILKRFGYNYQSSGPIKETFVPPFWIDMSLLFELYILSKLRAFPGIKLEYQFKASYGSTDILIDWPEHNLKLVADVKYKLYYKENFSKLDSYCREAVATDIRQISGYARDKKVLTYFGLPENTLLDCIVFYPKVDAATQFRSTLKDVPIAEFASFFKQCIGVPVI